MSEGYQAQKELAKTCKQVQDARRELDNLALDKEKFIKQRSYELQQDLAKTLSQSQKTIEATQAAQKDLEAIQRMAIEITEGSKAIAEALTVNKELFDEKVEKFGKEREEAEISLSKRTKEIKRQADDLKIRKRELEGIQKGIERQLSQVKDQRARLSAAMQEYGRRQ